MVAKWNMAVDTVPASTGIPLSGQLQIGMLTAGKTLRRTRMDMDWRMVGIPAGGGVGFSVAWQMNVRLTWGITLTNGATTPPNPPSPETIPPTTDWIIWTQERFYWNVYDAGSEYAELQCRMGKPTEESFGQRLVPATGVTAMWLAWHIDDPSNTLNTTDSENVHWSAGYSLGLHYLMNPG